MVPLIHHHATIHTAIANISAYSYLAIFLLTLCAGTIIPLPEELVLLIAGYSAGIGLVNFWIVIPVVMAGLFIVDIVLYSIGQHGGKLVLKFEHRLPQKTLTHYRRRFNTKPVATIIALRFISGIRILSPIFAAVWGIPLSVFALADFSALIVFTLLFVSLGFFFHNALFALTHGVALLQHFIFLGILIVLGIFFGIHAYRLFFSNKNSNRAIEK